MSIVDRINPHDKFTCMLVHSHVRAHQCFKVVDTFDQDSRVPGFRRDTYPTQARTVVSVRCFLASSTRCGVIVYVL
jgi:hypothetical protein